MEEEIDYTFDEDLYLAEMKGYIDSTYMAHYSGKYQATDMIIDAGHGAGFCIGSIMKYAKRYGKKNGYDRKDILKIIHYGIIMLHVHDCEHECGGEEPQSLPGTGIAKFIVDGVEVELPTKINTSGIIRNLPDFL